MPIPNPFHEGELRVQELAGERQDAEHTGRAIADSIIRGALKYVAQQSNPWRSWAALTTIRTCGHRS